MKQCSFDEVDKLHEELTQKLDESKIILKFLKKKIALEAEYATQVRHLCKSQPNLGSSGAGGCFSTLVGLVCDQASTTLSNLATLSIDAVSPLRAALLQLKGSVGETYTEGKKVQHERKKVFDNYKKAKYTYESISQESSLDRSITLAENDYKSHVTIVNNNQSSYFQDQLPRIIQQFETFETLRASRTGDVIQRFVTCLSDTATRCNEVLKAASEKMNKPALSSSADVDKYKSFCEQFTQTPSDVQFGQEQSLDKSEILSPSSLKSKFLKHGKSASAKWRNSFSALTSPHRESKKLKRQSMPLKSSAGAFGTPLHLLLEHQKNTYPKLDIPYVEYYLINHFKKIGGMHTENIFRVPGMTVEVQNIKAELEAGSFTEDLLSCSVHSTASAITTWLRELPSPLIPYYMHSHCLGYKTHEELLRIFYGLPTAHCNTLVYLLSFISDLSKTENQVKTHMDADNLAMVFTPSVLRSQNPSDCLTLIEKERLFVLSAIEAADMLKDTFPLSLQLQPENQTQT